MGFLENKKILIAGVASDRSIAAGTALAMASQGAQLAFTYQTEKLQKRVEKIAEACGSSIVIPCDVAEDEQIDNAFSELASHWDGLDGIVHSIAFAPRDELKGLFLDATSRDGFNMAHEISSYSFTALAKAGREMMQGRNAAMITMSYIGAVRSMPGYNVMGLAKASLEANVRYLAQSLGEDGIRVNAISAGPIKTLAASGIAGFKKMIDFYDKTAPLGRSVTIEEVGNAAAFLCSDLASGITGEITYVDGGFSTVGIGTGMVE